MSRLHRFLAVFLLAGAFRQRDLECSGESIQTIAFGSCNQPERVSLWPQMSSFNPHLVVLLGDNMYADKKAGIFPLTYFVEAEPEDIRKEYKLLEEDQSFINMVEKAGGWGNIAATFDDHDYGINNGNKSYMYRKESQELFWDFTNVPMESSLRQQNGVYSSKEYSINLEAFGGAVNDATAAADVQSNTEKESFSTDSPSVFKYKVIMLDLRSNSGEFTREAVGESEKEAGEREKTGKAKKEVNGKKVDGREGKEGKGVGGKGVKEVKEVKGEEGVEGDFLGEEQWSWLERELQSDHDLFLLGSSIQVLPTDKLTEERWNAYPSARRRLLNMIMRVESPVVILSGDVHYAEVSKARCWWESGESGESDSGNGGGVRAASGGRASGGRGTRDSTMLYELTSSGLTHTFSKKSPLQGKYGALQRDQMMATKNLYSLRGFMYDLYQATFPCYYREQRYADHYQGLNFGILDINIDSDDKESNRNGENVVKQDEKEKRVTSLTYRVMNHLGEAVITKNIPLKSKNIPRNILKQANPSNSLPDPSNENIPRSDFENFPGNDVKNVPGIGRGNVEHLVCEPFWGPLPVWRMFLSVAIIVFAVVVIASPVYLPLFFILRTISKFLFKELFLIKGSCLRTWLDKWVNDKRRR